MLKILLLKNQYSGKVKVQKYLDWFKDNGVFDYELEIKEVDIPVEPYGVGNQKWKGVIANQAKLVPELKKIVPENKYHAVAIYNENLNGIRLSSTTGNFYKDTELIQLDSITDNGKHLNHELFHVLVNRCNKRQINVPDVMDTYIGDTNFDLSDDTNRSRQLNLLKPHLDKILDFRTDMKTAILTRQKSDDKQTLGELVCTNGSNTFTCKTLELADNNNQRNISSIPKGIYKVKKTYSLKFGTVYQVQDVKNRTGIYIHHGNYFSDIQGCILVGNRFSDINADGKLDVINSKVTRKALENFFGLEEFVLVIK